MGVRRFTSNIEFLANGAGCDIILDISLDRGPILAKLFKIGKGAVSASVADNGIVTLRKKFNVIRRDGGEIGQGGHHVGIRSDGEVGAKAGHRICNLVFCSRDKSHGTI